MNNIQKMIDDAVEEFRKKLEKEFKEPELTGTQVELINKDLETVVYPVEEFDIGTLLNCGGWEAFLIGDGELGRRWVTFSGEQYADEQLADLMRHNGAKVMVIHWGL
jgi:hypothetical protein